MNLRKRNRNHPEGHASALNDILFILLLFFLIVGTLANPNVIKVSNPKGQTDSKAKQTVVISIDSMKRYYVGSKLVAADSLQSAISAVVSKSDDADPTVVINGDEKADWGEIMTAMRAAKALHLKVVAAVDKDK